MGRFQRDCEASYPKTDLGILEPDVRAVPAPGREEALAAAFLDPGDTEDLPPEGARHAQPAQADGEEVGSTAELQRELREAGGAYLSRSTISLGCPLKYLARPSVGDSLKFRSVAEIDMIHETFFMQG